MSKKISRVCFASFFAVLLVIIIFRRQWNITALSVVPVFLAVLSVFLVYRFRGEAEEASRTAYGNELTEREQRLLSRYAASAFAVLAPWQGIFVFFFDACKLFSVAVFCICFAAGPCLFRVRYGKELNERIRQEQRELEEQRKKEEQGKWR